MSNKIHSILICSCLVVSCAIPDGNTFRPDRGVSENSKADPMAGNFRIESTIKSVKLAIHDMENAERTYTALNPVGSPALSGSEKARERFRKAKDRCRKEFAKLRQELKVGTSIDSYPGLIDLGRVGYIGDNDTERNRLGWGILEILVDFYDTQYGDVEPQYYEIQFDQSRVIRGRELLPPEVE